MKFNTALLHGAAVTPYMNGATLPPISQVSAFSYGSMEELEKVFAHKAMGFAYTRIGNPTVAAFEQRVNELEHGAGAVACSSGMAAVTQTLLNLLCAGDEIVAAAGLYGGTIELLSNLSKFGITTHYVHSLTEAELDGAVNEHTKAVFGEVISNPSLEVLDIRRAADWAHAHGVPLIVDSTMATPYICTPISFGADIVIHSSSKYINGSGDAISGIVVDGGRFAWDFTRFPALADYKKFGKLAFLLRLRTSLWANTGGCLSPFNAYLNIIGLETLGLRMERICANAAALARALSGLDGITVNHPSLPENPTHELVGRQCGGHGGGVLTMRTGSKEKALKIIDSLKYAKIVSNIGDVRTLVLYPASTLYIHDTVEEMNAAGVFDDTIRVSVGIEDSDDLIEDFTAAIAAAK